MSGSVFKEPTSSVDDVEAGSLAASPSLAPVLPNSRHPVALWASALGSLDFLENRLLKERQKKMGVISITAYLLKLHNTKRSEAMQRACTSPQLLLTHNYKHSFIFYISFKASLDWIIFRCQ